MFVATQGAAAGRARFRARGLGQTEARAGGASLAALVAAAAVAYAQPAEAQVIEPDERQVPCLVGESEDVNADCCEVNVDGIDNISLQALFSYLGEPIDYRAHATTEPSYFSPLCGFRGTLLLRGGGCRIDFGWYNVDLNNNTPPLATEIYPLVTVADVNAWFTENNMPTNDANAFHPHVGERPIEGALIENLRDDPRYLGGLIGLVTTGNDTGGVCTQTHYSEPRLNQMSTFGAPWILALVWHSQNPNVFYIGFEDLPTDPGNFAKVTPEGYANDGDFNDFVYRVDGITCEGGGQPCLTGSEGACGFGLTECQPDGSLVCVSQVSPMGELCDNLDNDCNGLVDDGDLCPVGEVCDKGICKPFCSPTEFPCVTPLVCDESGFCVDPACQGIECPAGQVCLGGQCVGGCEGAVCPQGQVCQLGRCFDPCANRVAGGANPCPQGMVCEGGVCVESCHCRFCSPGTECNYDTGECVPTGCINVVCAEGTVCQNGACVDACVGVICPGGATCNAGVCGDPLPGYVPPVDGTAGATLIDPGPGLIDPGTGGTSSSNGGPAGVAAAPNTQAQDPGCGCRTATSRRTGSLAGLLLLALGLAGLGRRRR